MGEGEEVQSILFFFAMGSGKRAHDLGLCFYFLAVLVSLILSVSLMVWFFFSHFLGMSHTRVRFCFYFAGIFPREIVLYFGVSTLTIPFIFD